MNFIIQNIRADPVRNSKASSANRIETSLRQVNLNSINKNDEKEG